MATIYDHINREAGLIDKLPARSRIMASSINVTYEGNLAGLIEFLESHFKDPDCLVLKVEAVGTGNVMPLTPTDKLLGLILKDIEKRTQRMPQDMETTRGTLARGLPEILDLLDPVHKGAKKISAIKALRECANLGLRDAKEVIEDIVIPWVNLSKR